MKIKMKKLILDADNREIEVSLISGELIISGDEKIVSALSTNEREVLREEAENLLLKEFGDDV